jgi:hypothetical protein
MDFIVLELSFANSTTNGEMVILKYKFVDSVSYKAKNIFISLEEG